MPPGITQCPPASIVSAPREVAVERGDAAAVDADIAIRPARVERHAAATDHEVMHAATLPGRVRPILRP